MWNIDWGSAKFRLINVYAPADPVGRRELFLGLNVLLCSTRFLILGGDFNVCMDKGRDVSLKGLISVLNGFNLIDSFRTVNKQDSGFTWMNTRGSQSRIDYIFFTQGAENRVRVFVSGLVLGPLGSNSRGVGFRYDFWQGVLETERGDCKGGRIQKAAAAGVQWLAEPAASLRVLGGLVGEHESACGNSG